MKIPQFKKTVIALLGCISLFVFFFLGGVSLMMARQGSFTSNREELVILFPSIGATTPQIVAKAAVVFDPSNGRILYAKHAYEQLPLASITKLMTAQIVLSEVKPETLVRITPSSLEPQGDWGFKVDDVLPLYDLVKIGLVASSNDAMQAAAQSLGTNYIERMNQVARNLGLTATYFLNPTGLDVTTTTSGSYGSAYDVARLTALFYKQYPLFFEMTQQSNVSIQVQGRVLTSHATAEPLLSIPGFVGAKTGYTDLAGGNLVAVFDVEIGHPLVAVVLASTKEGRFSDIRTLISAVRNH